MYLRLVMPIQVDLAGLSRQDFWMVFNWGAKVALWPPKAEAQQTGALKPLQGSKPKCVFFFRKNTHFSNHDIFDSRSSLDLGSVSTDAHGLQRKRTIHEEVRGERYQNRSPPNR